LNCDETAYDGCVSIGPPKSSNKYPIKNKITDNTGLPFEILYIDNHLLVVCKPAGMLVQGDKTGDPTLLERARSYIKQEFNKPGNVYLGLVHRLDRPVSGVVVLARTSKAAGRLSRQIRNKEIEKRYWALVEGNPPQQNRLVDDIQREGATSKIVEKGTGKTAEMRYQRLMHSKGISLLEVDLVTGRHHQIRLQLANMGFPIIGDFRYGSKLKFPNRSIALHARSIQLLHPVQLKKVLFEAEPADYWPFYPAT